MSEQMYQLVALVIYMIALLWIGWYAYKKTTDLTDFMLGGRSLGPGVTALSAGAADMSGWLLMGLPGAIYLYGANQLWMGVGLLVGAYVNWLLVAPRLRAYTEVNDSITVPSYLEGRLKDTSNILRMVTALVILLFFTFYVSSGMVAGGKFFESSFGLDYHVGLLTVAAVVIAYTLFGGFLAVSYTDFFQGLIMFFALLLVPIGGIWYLGGWTEVKEILLALNPNHLNWTASVETGSAMYDYLVSIDKVDIVTFASIASALAWGLGYFGQPHIIVRFMAIESLDEVKSARRIGTGWMLLSLVGATFTAFVGLAYFSQNGGIGAIDPETVFIVMGQVLFHPLVAGIILAAVLAAIMSTISSQLIVTSSALVEDLHKAIFKKSHPDRYYVLLGRVAILVVSAVALALAWPNNESILSLVSFAWAGFGGAFGPIILLSLYWRRLTSQGAIAGMVVGAIIAFIWHYAPMDTGIFAVYEIIPAFLLNLVTAVVVSRFTFKDNPDIEKEFEATLHLLRNRK